MPRRFVWFSAFYFFYFATLGTYLPYWPIYLEAQGFALHEVGELMAIALLTKIFAPYIWGWLADKLRRRLTLIRWSDFIAFLAFVPIFYAKDYATIAVILFLFSFFWNASLPQVEVLTLNNLKYHAHRYSLIRLWGSVGFITMNVIGAWLISVWGSDVVPWLMLSLLFLLWLTTQILSESRLPLASSRIPSIVHAFNAPVVALFVICFLIQFVHGPYYAYFTIYMQEQGYQTYTIGWFWAVGVIAEVLVFIYCSVLLRRYSVSCLLFVVITATALRWLLLAYYQDNIAVILFAQSLHAITFGVYHAVLIHAISKLLPGGLEGRGQALYSSLSFGVGGGLGTYIASQLWEQMPSQQLFAYTSLLTLIALFCLLPLRHAERREPLRSP
ncbi:MAG: MFS transporter [Gammaproteobacteria bacterium]|nr:MFS transporter [Gammaproteobacteria bacterium]